MSATKNVAQRSPAFRSYELVIFSEITEKECVKERYPTPKRKFDFRNIARPSQQ